MTSVSASTTRRSGERNATEGARSADAMTVLHARVVAEVPGLGRRVQWREHDHHAPRAEHAEEARGEVGPRRDEQGDALALERVAPFEQSRTRPGRRGLWPGRTTWCRARRARRDGRRPPGRARPDSRKESEGMIGRRLPRMAELPSAPGRIPAWRKLALCDVERALEPRGVRGARPGLRGGARLGGARPRGERREGYAHPRRGQGGRRSRSRPRPRPTGSPRSGGCDCARRSTSSSRWPSSTRRRARTRTTASGRPGATPTWRGRR